MIAAAQGIPSPAEGLRVYHGTSRCHSTFFVNFPSLPHPAEVLPRGVCGALLAWWILACPASAVAVEVRAGLWTADGPVYALALDRNAGVLYIGGEFGRVGPADPLAGPAVDRRNLAAFDLDSGEVTAWDPAADGPVHAMWLNPNGTTLYVGGDFAAAGGQFRQRLAALDTTLGLPGTWNPGADGPVRTMLPSASNGTLYIGGEFTRVAGAERHGLAELGVLGIGALTGLGQQALFESGAVVNALATGGGRLYVGGRFTPAPADDDEEDEEPEEPAAEQRLAAIELAPFRLAEWSPPIDDGQVLALHPILDRNVIYAGGDFTSVAAAPQRGAALFDLVSGDTLPWNPRFDGPVRALVASLDRGVIYAGGEFSTAAGVARARLAAIDSRDGTPLAAWDAAADAATHTLLAAWNVPVAPVEEDEDAEDEGTEDEGAGDENLPLYAGGAFTLIDGLPRAGVAALEVLPPEREPPSTRAEPPAGFISAADDAPGTVILLCDDGTGSGCAATYYTLDGSDPDTGSNRYLGPISITVDAEVRYFSVDHVGNAEDIGASAYIVEMEPPVTSADPPSGVFDDAVLVRLSCTDARPGCVETRYTTDGTLPNASSPLYTGPITIDRTAVLQYFSVDGAGNVEGVRRSEYVRSRGEAGALGFAELVIFSIAMGVPGWRRLRRGGNDD